MPDVLFKLPEDPNASLQTRIREMLVSAILDGHLPPGSPVPSGRKLAQQLKVARNTVVLAYEHLVDEGFLIARERSGFYVSEDILKGRIGAVSHHSGGLREPAHWQGRIRLDFSHQRQIQKPADWQRYQYPFLYGQFDPALFPIADWRECCRDAASIRAIHAWAGDRADRDDPELIEQIHTRVLPRRGVFAGDHEILVTLGAQHALYLAAQLLVNAERTVGMEEPGYTDARNVFNVHTRNVRPLSLDAHGLKIDSTLDDCDCVYVTPSHQFPTTITMPIERRRELLKAADEKDFILIEDDYESELNYADEPVPALKSLDESQRVLYIGSLSKTLAPGLRMGYLVGPPGFITQARALRRLMLRHPPANNQFIVSQFLKRGFHDALVRRLHHTLRDRWRVMIESLDLHFPSTDVNHAFGGSAFWVRLPEGIDADELEVAAREQSILIEAGSVFFNQPQSPCGWIRLGFSSIASDRIPQGIKQLAAVIKSL
ncbi:MAG: GntR family transcriptional regulator [marine bacterium B5-7]|nr:MAG: GntR family transcriptional regulator [marine bacterium B5-7]